MNRQFFRILVASVLATYALVFAEWLFNITKLSFLSDLTSFEKLVALTVTPLPLVLCFIAVILLLRLFVSVKYLGKFSVWVAMGVPVLVFAGLELLLIDNFTHVVFQFNVGSFTGFWRYVYLLFFLALFILTYRYLYARIMHAESRSYWIGLTSVSVVLLTVSVVLLAAKSGPSSQIVSDKYEKKTSTLPNIIIFSTDGIDADRMSAYGYKRETTPFLDSMLGETLFFENSLVNAAHTGGSLVSLLTGKLPTETRVYYPPNTLQGTDMFQHLPGILHKLGYYNGEVSLRHYADSIDFNMRDAFDYANFRYVANSLKIPKRIRLAYTTEIYFLERVVERVMSRILHIAGVRDMLDYYSIVTVKPGNDYLSDEKRYFQIINFIEEYPQPFFLNVHMLGTHGPIFYIFKPHFSKGQKQKQEWMKDFADDAMRKYDNYLRYLVDFLKERGLYDNTMIIVNADHGMIWQNRVRVPLIIKFPDGEYAGRKVWNAQRLDIAPTVLDYLGIKPPEWMEGMSLLSDAPDRLRPAISVRIKREKKRNKQGKMIQVNLTPPFYALGRVDVMRCNRWVSLNLMDASIKTGKIRGHTKPCSDDELPSLEEEKEFLIQHMEQKGYDVSSLRK